MKRIITIILAAVALTLGLAVPATAIPVPSALPLPIPGCQERTVTSSVSPPSWLQWVGSIDGHRGGSFRISSGCGRTVRYTSYGQAFEGMACTMVRIFYPRTGERTDWVIACGGGPTVRVAGMAPVNEPFFFECRDTRARARQPQWHCLFTIEF